MALGTRQGLSEARGQVKMTNESEHCKHEGVKAFDRTEKGDETE